MEIQYHYDSSGNLTGTTMDQEYKDHVDGMKRGEEMVATVLTIAGVSVLVLGALALMVLDWLVKALT